ncbi:MAG: 30S ribosomal protein S11 [Bacteroidota bacterium]|nr:30S ribosomal protein S11 [Bacteroidota bacterium]
MAKRNTQRTVVRKKKVAIDSYGRVFIQATFNNCIISITNLTGQVISWSSAGKMGFKGSKKNTPYAATTAANDCGKVAFDLGLRKVDVQVKGPGAGREAAIRALSGLGIEVMSIQDVTPIPHNGCRPPNKRRV